jgi:pimeloyl-ACP methyl ester carboxylesterase
MGGLIALEVALSARERVRSLSLLCSFPRGRDAVRLKPEMLWTMFRTSVGTRAQRRIAFLKLVMSASALEVADTESMASRLAPLFGHDLADQPPVSMKQLSAMVRYDAMPRLPALAGLPTLVVSATEDRIARPKVGRAMAARIPGARFVELSNAAHGACIQHAARFNTLLMEHLG